MKLTEALAGLGRPVAYYPGLSRCLGSVPAALLVAQFWYWRERQQHEYLYKTGAELENELGLSMKAQRTARKLLVERRILREKYDRLRHEMHFWVDWNRLDEEWSKYQKRQGMCPKGTSGNAVAALREVPKGHMAKRPKGTSIPETTVQRLPTERERKSLSPSAPNGETRTLVDELQDVAREVLGAKTAHAVKAAKLEGEREEIVAAWRCMLEEKPDGAAFFVADYATRWLPKARRKLKRLSRQIVTFTPKPPDPKDCHCPTCGCYVTGTAYSCDCGFTFGGKTAREYTDRLSAEERDYDSRRTGGSEGA